MAKRRDHRHGRTEGHEQFSSASSGDSPKAMDIAIDITGTLFLNKASPHLDFLKFVIEAIRQGHKVTLYDPMPDDSMVNKLQRTLEKKRDMLGVSPADIRRWDDQGCFKIHDRDELMDAACQAERVFNLVFDDDPVRYTTCKMRLYVDPTGPEFQAFIKDFNANPSQDTAALVNRHFDVWSGRMEPDFEPDEGEGGPYRLQPDEDPDAGRDHLRFG